MKAKVAADTGRSWDEWIALARRSGLKDAASLKARLRGHLGLKPMTASWIAHEALTETGSEYDDPDRLVDALYAGERATLRPLHDALVDEFAALGDDVVVTACKTKVPVYRKHVFAELRPAGAAVELRLALGDVKPVGRLKAVARGQPGERMTHVVRLHDVDAIDGQLRAWMAVAYAQGASVMVRPSTARVPPDLEKAVTASRAASATWAGMTPAMRRDVVEWVVGAKQEDTRLRRIATAVARLAQGRRKIY
jgi:hypothetical protein